MSQWLDPQLLLALAIVALALAAIIYLVRQKISDIGFLREDFDRRAGWLALGVIVGAVLLYLKYR
jgi:hypothetical protein